MREHRFYWSPGKVPEPVLIVLTRSEVSVLRASNARIERVSSITGPFEIEPTCVPTNRHDRPNMFKVGREPKRRESRTERAREAR